MAATSANHKAFLFQLVQRVEHSGFAEFQELRGLLQAQDQLAVVAAGVPSPQFEPDSNSGPAQRAPCRTLEHGVWQVNVLTLADAAPLGVDATTPPGPKFRHRSRP